MGGDVVLLAFTDKALRELEPPTDEPQEFYWDTKQSGLQYVLGRGGTGSFVAVYQRDGKKVRETLGRYGEMTLPEARKAHQGIMGRVAEGKVTPGDLRRVVKNGPTVAEAARAYVAALGNKSRRPSSIKTVVKEVLGEGSPNRKSYVSAWLDRPLRSITARECRERHEEISKNHGPHVANRVLRNLRAIWNFVAREAPEEEPWPQNFTRSVNWHSGERPDFVERRQEPVPWAQLPTWRRAIDTFTPARRDFQLVVLLTGLRRTDSATIRWEHVNLSSEPVEAQVWHAAKQRFDTVEIAPQSILRPNPKGGPKKAFSIPLSSVLLKILQDRRDAQRALGANDGGWVFPTRATKGQDCDACRELGLGPHQPNTVSHIVYPVDYEVRLRDDISGAEKTVRMPTPHRLRDTYITAGEQAGVPDGIVKVLVNHRKEKGDVTARYRLQDHEFLRECQQKISDFLLARMQPATTTRPHLHLVSDAA